MLKRFAHFLDVYVERLVLCLIPLVADRWTSSWLVFGKPSSSARGAGGARRSEYALSALDHRDIGSHLDELDALRRTAFEPRECARPAAGACSGSRSSRQATIVPAGQSMIAHRYVLPYSAS